MKTIDTLDTVQSKKTYLACWHWQLAQGTTLPKYSLTEQPAGMLALCPVGIYYVCRQPPLPLTLFAIPLRLSLRSSDQMLSFACPGGKVHFKAHSAFAVADPKLKKSSTALSVVLKQFVSLWQFSQIELHAPDIMMPCIYIMKTAVVLCFTVTVNHTYCNCKHLLQLCGMCPKGGCFLNVSHK